MKLMLVPQLDIDKIEEARNELYKIIKGLEENKIKTDDIFIYTINVTQPIYQLTHRKYKQSFWNKIFIKLIMLVTKF